MLSENPPVPGQSVGDTCRLTQACELIIMSGCRSRRDGHSGEVRLRSDVHLQAAVLKVALSAQKANAVAEITGKVDVASLPEEDLEARMREVTAAVRPYPSHALHLTFMHRPRCLHTKQAAFRQWRRCTSASCA